MADVQCENCRGIFHEITPLFKRGVPAKGYMLRLKEPWKSYGWEAFPETEDFGYASLECPGCGVPYAAGSGLLTIIEDNKVEDSIKQPVVKRRLKTDKPKKVRMKRV